MGITCVEGIVETRVNLSAWGLYLKAFYSKNIIKMLKAQQISVEIYWLTLIHTSHHLFLQKQTLTTLE